MRRLTRSSIALVVADSNGIGKAKWPVFVLLVLGTSLVDFPRMTVPLTVSSGATTISLARYPASLLFSPTNGYMYVAGGASGTIDIFSGGTLVANLSVGRIEPTCNGCTNTYVAGNYPQAMTYDDYHNYVYVSDNNPDSTRSGIVSVINNTQVVGSVVSGNFPEAIAYDSQNHFVYSLTALQGGNGSVTVISGLEVIANISVGLGAYGAIIFDPASGYMYVTNQDSGTVSVISGTALVATVSVGELASNLLLDPDNGYVYVSGGVVLNGTQRVTPATTIISGTKVVGQLVGVSSPFAYDFKDRLVYASLSNQLSSNTGSICLLSGTSIVGNVTLPLVQYGSTTIDLEYDKFNGNMYDSRSVIVNPVPGPDSTIGEVLQISDSNFTGMVSFGGGSPNSVYFDPSSQGIYVIVSDTIVILTPSAFILSNSSSQSTIWQYLVPLGAALAAASILLWRSTRLRKK